MNEKPTSLRAHHGMCLAFFRGRGYSEEFTRHMSAVQECLRRNPPVALLARADDICTHCPNLRGSICETAAKVEGYDKKVLELCGLREGEVVDWEEFSLLVRERILDAGKRKAICGDCQWSEFC